MTTPHLTPGMSCNCRRPPARPIKDTHCSTAAEPELLTVPEVMTRLCLGRTAVYDLIRSRRLASITIGRARRIPARAVHDLIAHESEEHQ